MQAAILRPSRPRQRQIKGGGCIPVIQGCGRMAIDPRMPAMREGSPPCSHRPYKYGLHQVRSAVTCWASCTKGEPHSILGLLVRWTFLHMQNSAGLTDFSLVCPLPETVEWVLYNCLVGALPYIHSQVRDTTASLVWN